MALACHIRIAGENAQFGLPEVSLGILPGYGGTQRLPQLVGKGKAFELIMTGDIISATEALNIGLVNKIVPLDNLYEACEEMLHKIMQKSPVAIAQVVECIYAAFDEEEDGYQVESDSFSICCKADDFKEGTAAFLEKRKPQFTGR